MKYVALLRGVNVGGKNKISMVELRACLEKLGYDNVSTYINSGNVVFASSKNASDLAKEIETALITNFKFDSELIKVLVLSAEEIERVVKNAPQGFGSQPDKYYSDAVFLIGVSAEAAFAETECNPEVDKAWLGEGVIYYQRLGSGRTRSRLSKVISKPVYKSMTIRSWNTVRKLDEIMNSKS